MQNKFICACNNGVADSSFVPQIHQPPHVSTRSACSDKTLSSILGWLYTYWCRITKEITDNSAKGLKLYISACFPYGSVEEGSSPCAWVSCNFSLRSTHFILPRVYQTLFVSQFCQNKRVHRFLCHGCYAWLRQSAMLYKYWFSPSGIFIVEFQLSKITPRAGAHGNGI